MAALLAGCGSNGGPAVEPVLRAGAAAVAVTPVVEGFEDLDGDRERDKDEPFDDLDGDGEWDAVWIAGFGAERAAQGVHDDIWARALVLDRGEVRIAVVAVDWVGLQHDQALVYRQAALQADPDLDHLVISCTHNHEGPDTMGIWGGLIHPGVDPAYMQWAGARIQQAVTQATERLAPVRVVAGVGRTEGLTHDSRLPEVKDEQVLALRFDRTDGSGTEAVVVHWSNHPEVLGGSQQQITADFPHYLVGRVEGEVPGAVGIYWQGMVGGLLNPLNVHVTDAQGNPLPDSSFEKAQRIGELVAEEALAALAAGEDVGVSARLAFRRRTFLVPFDNPELELLYMGGFFERSVFDAEGHRRSPDFIQDEEAHLMTETTVVDLGAVQLATVPGELYPELGLVGPDGQTYYQDPQDPAADFQGVACAPPIQASMRDTPYKLVLGLANDEVGYIIPRCQWDRAPPYTYGDDEAPYGEGLSPGPEMAPILNAVLAEELEALATD